jgi:hypothetical protein
MEITILGCCVNYFCDPKVGSLAVSYRLHLRSQDLYSYFCPALCPCVSPIQNDRMSVVLYSFQLQLSGGEKLIRK